MAIPIRNLLVLGFALTAAVTTAFPSPDHLDVRDPDATCSSMIQASSTSSSANGAATISVESLLEKAIGALGGVNALTSLRGVSAHA